MLSKVFVFKLQLVFHLIISPTGYADTTSIGKGFDTSGNVDTVSVDSTVFINDISEIDTNTKLHLAVIRQFSIAFRQFPLDFHSTIDGINNADKLS